MFNQTVAWNEIILDPISGSQLTGTAVTADLVVTIGDIEIGGSTDNAELVNIFVSFDSDNWFEVTKSQDAEIELTIEVLQTVYFRVTLTEPSNFTEYQAVANKPITFTITYSIDEDTISPN